ncbi:MAG: glutamate 5-kinase [Xanthomonadales bacterium]|nr:glutamate 5-kinase [Gammaproteobacteria bacterium]NNJ79111.1 glutamate 5-kinase [Xanthomonadales bacterium]NNL05202.1 glutamate 5-kinase [Xanthomonadales bacterium]
MSGRIVVKIGSQVLCGAEGELNLDVLEQLVGQIARLVADDWQVLLVSSGAVAAGLGVAGDSLNRVSDPVARKQVLAATGQVRLMENYRSLFAGHRLTVAQILASKSDFQTRRHYLNMRGCIDGLLSAGIVPIVNENDVVSITELMFTDNDELAGLLAGMVKADMLCLLSTVPGVFDGNPDDTDTRLIAIWDDAEHRPEDVVQRGASTLGRGGMHSKLNMARKTAQLGTTVIIADGADTDILHKIISGRPAGTRFPAAGEASSAKRWLASADAHAVGSVTVNTGAVDALLDRSRLASLLPVGIESVEGPFSQGDVIQVRAPDGTVLGCGRAAYGHEKAGEVRGQRGHKPLIHYDYLYLVD